MTEIWNESNLRRTTDQSWNLDLHMLVKSHLPSFADWAQGTLEFYWEVEFSVII